MSDDFMRPYKSEVSSEAQIHDEDRWQDSRRGVVDAHDLLNKDLPEPKRLIPWFLTEGLSVIAGPPKIGKSTLNKLMALALVNGGQFLGQPCPGAVKVLELQFEESQRLFRKKLIALQSSLGLEKGTYSLQFEPERGSKGAAWLDQILSDRKFNVVIVDSLTAFRELSHHGKEGFRADYEAINMISAVAKRHPGVAIRLVHHTTKARPDRPIDSISGTNGLVAAIDDYMILDEFGGRFRLHCGGRNWDEEESDFELTRSSGSWVMQGPWSDGAALSELEQTVLTFLQNEGTISGNGLARRCERDTGNMHRSLQRMVNKGIILHLGDGYCLP